MLSNIKPSKHIIEYPVKKLLPYERLTEQDIIKYIVGQFSRARKYEENLDYYMGRNKAIVNKESVDENAPDNRLVAPYARTMTQIVKGYMGKPQNISYHSEDDIYLDEIKDIFDENDEPLQTARIIEDQSRYGVAFEMLYTSEEDGRAIPELIICNPQSIIPIFEKNYDDSLSCFIKFTQNPQIGDELKTYSVEVGYSDVVQIFTMIDQGNNSFVLTEDGEMQHFFGDVPLVIYKNNSEYLADYEPVKTLIDSYDLLLSTSMNESERFASAYLILKNVILADSKDPSQQKVMLERIKQSRIFSVSNDGDVQFLTKDIPTAFIDSMRQALREDIQYHSHIPDFRDQAFRAQSGEAQKWALFDFENLCSDKEAYIREGLEERLELISTFLSFGVIESEDKIFIKFERNVPSNDTIQIDNVIKIKNARLLSDKDLLELLPKDMIGDIEEKLKNLEEQKLTDIDMFNMPPVEGAQDTTDQEPIVE